MKLFLAVSGLLSSGLQAKFVGTRANTPCQDDQGQTVWGLANLRCGSDNNFDPFQEDPVTSATFCVSDFAGIELYKFSRTRSCEQGLRGLEKDTLCRKERRAKILRLEKQARQMTKRGQVFRRNDYNRVWLKCDRNGGYDVKQQDLNGFYCVEPEFGEFAADVDDDGNCPPSQV